MQHEPAFELGMDNSARQKARLGVWMFIFYTIIYTGFVLIGTFFPKLMGFKGLGGMNLAFIYGMGLIVLAFVMGLIYNFLCTRLEIKLNEPEQK